MGQLARGRSPAILKVTLGSCVGVAFVWRERALFGMAHCLLPRAPEPLLELGARYVDQAIMSLLRMLDARPEHHARIEAYLAGGGNMMRRDQSAGRVPQLGQLNIEAALSMLRAQRIAVHATDLGGVHARQMRLNCATASVSVMRLPVIERDSAKETLIKSMHRGIE